MHVTLSQHSAIDQLVSRGGMASMMNTIWLIITALAFGGVVEKARVLDRIITPIVQAVKSFGALVTAMVASVLATNVVAADQYIATVSPGRIFRSAFLGRRHRRRHHPRRKERATERPGLPPVRSAHRQNCARWARVRLL